MSIDTVAETMLKIAERFGVPVVVLGIILWLGREAAISVNRTVVAPVVEAHTKFVDTVVEQVRVQTSAMEGQANAFRDLAEAHEQQLQILKQAFPEASVAGGRHREPVAHP